ncbi:MAG: FKBP-type peptidyl-prolyl cis-trans isomerase FkpA [Flavobacteriales bacterium]|jgi:FKBP-type peptidyl-prolyl cis-trans isomerase FkpA
MKNVLIALMFIGFIHCSCQQKQVEQKSPINQQELEAVNKRFLRLEALDIKNFVKRKSLNTIKTGTGVELAIYEKGNGQQKAKKGKVAVIAYTISLLNGTECYKTEPGKPDEFLVEYDDVESGLHEAIQYLSVGDKAVIIIPSHRAHGIAGDHNKIPRRSTIVYNLTLLAVKNYR